MIGELERHRFVHKLFGIPTDVSVVLASMRDDMVVIVPGPTFRLLRGLNPGNWL